MNNFNTKYKVTKRAQPTLVSYADPGAAYTKTGTTGSVRNGTSASNITLNGILTDGSLDGFALDYSSPGGAANMRATVTASAEL